MASPPITEGFVAFHHESLPDEECKTWYRIAGDLASGRRPLVVLHGGPGVTHVYLTTPFDQYAAKTGTPVVYYDQIGCGRSTHIRGRYDEEFWVIDLFIAELDNLVQQLGIRNSFDLYGHSWGAMLAPNYPLSHVSDGSGLNKMILGSGSCTKRLRDELDNPARKAIRELVAKGKSNTPQHGDAIAQFNKTYVCRLETWPQILYEAFGALKDDDTVYRTMLGPDMFTLTGNLRGKRTHSARTIFSLTATPDFDMTESCKRITTPCLVISGEFDGTSHASMKPWVEGIPHAKWIIISDGSHMVHLEQPNKYIDIVGKFLESSD